MKQSVTQLRRFLIVGFTTVGIDFAVYTLGLSLGVAAAPAKTISFISGMIFAWFANRLYTFSATGGPRRFAIFIALYLLTLGLNVTVNQLSLSLFGETRLDILVAFVIATGLSAISNFIGMKFLVFR